MWLRSQDGTMLVEPTSVYIASVSGSEQCRIGAVLQHAVEVTVLGTYPDRRTASQVLTGIIQCIRTGYPLYDMEEMQPGDRIRTVGQDTGSVETEVGRSDIIAFLELLAKNARPGNIVEFQQIAKDLLTRLRKGEKK